MIGSNQTTYSIPCRCSNCFHRFSVSVPKGTPLEQNATWDGLMWYEKEKTFPTRVKCPNCECEKVCKEAKL